jgi:hypothetical protein
VAEKPSRKDQRADANKAKHDASCSKEEPTCPWRFIPVIHMWPAILKPMILESAVNNHEKTQKLTKENLTEINQIT